MGFRLTRWQNGSAELLQLHHLLAVDFICGGEAVWKGKAQAFGLFGCCADQVRAAKRRLFWMISCGSTSKCVWKIIVMRSAGSLGGDGEGSAQVVSSGLRSSEITQRFWKSRRVLSKTCPVQQDSAKANVDVLCATVRCCLICPCNLKHGVRKPGRTATALRCAVARELQDEVKLQ